MNKHKIAIIGNIASLGYLIGSELEKRGQDVDYYCVPNIFTTSPPRDKIVERRKARGIPLERTFRRMWTSTRTYDLEIRLSAVPLVNASKSVVIFNGTELRAKSMSAEPRCFVTTRDLLEYLPDDIDARFLPRCIDIHAFNAGRDRSKNAQSGNLTIGHFPTDKSIKGTDLVIEAIRHLRDEGISCNLVSEIVPHSEMPSFLSKIDVLCDWFGREAIYGIVSVESLAIGTPVVCHVDDRYYDFDEMRQWIEPCMPEPRSIASAIINASKKILEPDRICQLYAPSNTVDSLIGTLREWNMW